MVRKNLKINPLKEQGPMQSSEHISYKMLHINKEMFIQVRCASAELQICFY